MKGNIEIGAEALAAYKRLDYTYWYALAEFIDNSTQAFVDNSDTMPEILLREGCPLRIDITYDKDSRSIVIEDNCIGMDEPTLLAALKLGNFGKEKKGRSKYGLGMKTAATWIGKVWTITTKKFGETTEYNCTVDVDAILHSKDTDVDIIERKSLDANLHYTRITIQHMYKKIPPRTATAICKHLSRMYAHDTQNGVVLTFNGQLLTWRGYSKRLYEATPGKPYQKKFSFSIFSEVDNKEVERCVRGWVGVLNPGSREEAGFTVYMNNRVIIGQPAAYRPSSIFGSSEGTNTLVNQRLVGELHLDNFEVTHTKNAIFWEDNDEEEFEKKLEEHCKEARDLASDFRPTKDVVVNIKKAIAADAPSVQEEVNSAVFFNTLDSLVLYSRLEENLEEDKQRRVREIEKEGDPVVFNIELIPDPLRIELYFVSRSSSEPYLFVDYASDPNLIVGFFNEKHPYYQVLPRHDVFEFLRSCVYDAIAEWKCRKHYGTLKSNVFRQIKDQFLRVPMALQNTGSNVIE